MRDFFSFLFAFEKMSIWAQYAGMAWDGMGHGTCMDLDHGNLGWDGYEREVFGFFL